MNNSPSTKISVVLKLLLLGFALPLLSHHSAWGQDECSEAEIKADIAQFDNKDSDSPFNSVVKCGSASVDSLREVLRDKNRSAAIREQVAFALAKIDDKDAVVEAIDELNNALKDTSPYVRSNAAFALAELAEKGEKAKVKPAIDNLITVLDTDDSIIARDNAIYALGNMGKEGLVAVPALIKELRTSTTSDKVAYSLAKLLWTSTYPNLLLAIVTHALFWTGLIFLYPKSPSIQAIFFWNHRVRKYFGFWYIDFALTWIPFLCSRLFSPFRDSLLSDAHLNSELGTYFPNSYVKLKLTESGQPITTESQSITEVIPEIKGQLIIEGESGLGKSMLLRDLARKSKRIVVYLLARECDKGVIEAIKDKLHGHVKEDPNFLTNLIYSGAIDICIDGLSEVAPDTRAIITTFVKNYSKGNIIMSTQPLEWLPPSTAITYVLQPLKEKQVEQFLISRKSILSKDAIKYSDYEQVCKHYLTTIFNSEVPEEAIANRQMLSNPMELTIVARMLSQGKTPDLLNLQQQQFDIMKADYEKHYPAKSFPLKTFAEAVYQMRLSLNNKAEISPEEWKKELQCMERHKMVISRQVTDDEGKSKTEWYFRHDKIQDFFIMQTFLDEPKDNRLFDQISDPRFRGVYFLLARLMPVEEAKALREFLIQHAADTKDHTVSDPFIQLFRSRQTK